MFKVHLPISDATRKRLYPAFGCLAGVFIFSSIFLSLYCRQTGALAPDPSTGRIYRMDIKGAIYVLHWQSEAIPLLFWGMTVSFALMLAVNPHRGRAFPLRGE
ncbi:MAG TPA: hypothetical protein VFV07_02745 [Rhizomicrobium sp.]|nr:hypothetical protein [Rhizomicrobium sp.]